MLFPLSIDVQHRTRTKIEILAVKLLRLVTEGREVMVDQIEKRFFSVTPTPSRLVQIYMSKQMPASKVLPAPWLLTAEGFYLRWMRETATMLPDAVVLVQRTPAPSKSKKRTSGGFFDNCDDSDDLEAPLDDSTDDPVLIEIAHWSLISVETIKQFTDQDQLLNEFALVFFLREQFPIHYLLFKRLAAHLPHEGNAESTFSLSGSLSNDNTQTSPDFLSICTRINKNKEVCSPSRDILWKAYKHRYGKLKEDDEFDDAPDSGSEDVAYESDGSRDDDE